MTGHVNSITATLTINGQGKTTTAAPVTNTTAVLSPITKLVTVVFRLVFNTTAYTVNASYILNMAKPFFPSLTSRAFYTLDISNITFENISANAFVLILSCQVRNLSVPVGSGLSNETSSELQDTINNLLQRLLLKSSNMPLTFPPITFTNTDEQIQAAVVYTLPNNEITNPSDFLTTMLKISGNLPTTTAAAPVPTVLLTSFTSTTASTWGFPGWALAIIIPCGIAILLLPLWIFLCCLLCGCCAAWRRRWHRRQSYQVQYPTRNGLF
nr:PREDICTED: uncharacterized protein LOC107076165 [Lepisosteus oculatus]